MASTLEHYEAVTRRAELRITDPDQLYSMLRASDRKWRGDGCRWIFRGQGDANWKLVPSAWRPSDLLSHIRVRAEAEYEVWWSKNSHVHTEALKASKVDVAEFKRSRVDALTELQAVREFIRSAGRSGLLAGDVRPSENERQTDLVSLYGLVEELLGNDVSIDAVAIAQHHGIPTRLLDFTSDPSIALYFCCEHARRLMQTRGLDGEAAVWAVDAQWHHGNGSLLRVREVPRPYSSYITAQRGLFGWVPYPKRYLVGEELAPLEFYRQFAPDSWREAMPDRLPLCKVVFPWSLVPDLFSRLSADDKAMVNFMPTLDNVTRAMRLNAGLPER